MHEPMMGPWGWTGSVFMIAFWALLIVALVLWIKSLLRQERRASAFGEPESALEILKKRYAVGRSAKKNSKSNAAISSKKRKREKLNESFRCTAFTVAGKGR
ncbi:MAG: hypothetical protein H8K03_18340 [Nitrospira sp.]